MIAQLRRNRRKEGRSDIYYTILFALLFLFIVGWLVTANVRVNNNRNRLLARIDGLQQEIQSLEERSRILQENISEEEKRDYLERAAREQLGLKAEGEEVVVITRKKEEEKKEKGEEEQSSWSPKSWWDWMKDKARD